MSKSHLQASELVQRYQLIWVNTAFYHAPLDVESNGDTTLPFHLGISKYMMQLSSFGMRLQSPKHF